MQTEVFFGAFSSCSFFELFGSLDHAFRDMSVADVSEVFGLTDRFLFGVFREK
ncbi:MAG: hypothetical protein PHU43_03375 [Candidatus Bipolaricaulis sp.]|nr:hypothetical protein [Candidatus Bipolaricaulis sp.]